ncbi:hypothetical protein DWF00_07610 [Bosea caraganae]|uniref:Uncharacterized protein n=1 Tax=Bosea caraganae TaxID=2763117 RepID=A0A370L0Z3_9HYPH|nr:hypothetical protein [Bosea caraganae]RDJ21077.1 hypothetical protein DWE98_22405 [Bosea caraganae]RDJ28576.1 hypothetical protein DWF00_07610 [Bosea caraganae]
MFDFPFKALPAPLLAGLLFYAAICALWLQPLVERRMAEKTFIPQCEARSIAVQAERRQEVDSEARRKKSILDQFARSPLAQLPFMKETLDIAEAEIAKSVPKIPRLRAVDHSSRCACAVTTAFDAIRFPMLLHVMSARVYAPAQLGTMPAAIDGLVNANECRSDKR